MVRIETVNPVFAMWGSWFSDWRPTMHVSINNKEVLPVVFVHGAPLFPEFFYIPDVPQVTSGSS
jgi:hypothetical protein